MRWPDCAMTILRRPTRCSFLGTHLISRALASSAVCMCIFPGRKSRMQLEAIIDCSPRSAGTSEFVMAGALYLKFSSGSMPGSAIPTGTDAAWVAVEACFPTPITPCGSGNSSWWMGKFFGTCPSIRWSHESPGRLKTAQVSTSILSRPSLRNTFEW